MCVTYVAAVARFRGRGLEGRDDEAGERLIVGAKRYGVVRRTWEGKGGNGMWL